MAEEIDLVAAGRKTGIDMSQPQQLSGGGDPTRFLTYLAKAGDWIDGSQRVRRQTVAITVKQPVPISVDLTIDYKRFGVPVDVHAPAATETADAADLSGG